MKPWQLLKQTTAYQNKYRRVLKRRYRMPNGKQSDFYIVDRGRVVCVLVATKDRHIILAKQFRPGTNRVLWELVGGKVERGETSRHAAQRETREETGYTGKLEYLGTSTNDAWSTLRRYHFLIRDARRVGELQLDEHEFIEAESVTLSYFRKLLKAGKLSDTETAYRALDHLHWL